MIIAGMPKDRRTRYQAVYARHQKRCRTETGDGRCNCKPSYYGVVYDRVQRKLLRTRRMSTVDAARNARTDLAAAARDGGDANPPRSPADRRADPVRRGRARGPCLEQAWAPVQDDGD